MTDFEHMSGTTGVKQEVALGAKISGIIEEAAAKDPNIKRAIAQFKAGRQPGQAPEVHARGLFEAVGRVLPDDAKAAIASIAVDFPRAAADAFVAAEVAREARLVQDAGAIFTR